MLVRFVSARFQGNVYIYDITRTQILHFLKNNFGFSNARALGILLLSKKKKKSSEALRMEQKRK